MRRYCFLINSASNSFRAKAFFQQREKALLELFPDSSFVYIGKEDSIQEIARLKAKEYTHVIACGGDGTVSQTANGLSGTDTVMGVIPLGSGNDFAKNIGLNKDFDHNVKILKENYQTSIDVIKGDWGAFINSLGIGVDGLTNYYSQNSPFKNGALKYFFGGVKALLTSGPIQISLDADGEDLLKNEWVWMIAIANGKTEGGKYKISPNSEYDDGRVEMIVVNKISRIRLIYQFIKLSLGYPLSPGVVREFSFSTTATIQTNEVAKAHADGEQVTGPKIFKLNVLESHLKVVISP